MWFWGLTGDFWAVFEDFFADSGNWVILGAKRKAYASGDPRLKPWATSLLLVLAYPEAKARACAATTARASPFDFAQGGLFGDDGRRIKGRRWRGQGVGVLRLRPVRLAYGSLRGSAQDDAFFVEHNVRATAKADSFATLRNDKKKAKATAKLKWILRSAALRCGV